MPFELAWYSVDQKPPPKVDAFQELDSTDRTWTEWSGRSAYRGPYRDLVNESLLVLIDRPGGTNWKTWDKHIREHLLRDQLISPDDLNLYHITDSADEAVKIITRFYRNFHSSRFVKELFVIRLKHSPSDSAIEAMNEDFADIILGEPIHRIDPAPEEVEDNDNIVSPRIAFGFNRRDYGRLRQLYDLLNGL